MTQNPSASLSIDGPHWAFSLALYDKPDVPPACLTLQDRFGVDVSVLLMALYGAVKRGRHMGAGEVVRLEAAASAWRRAVVEPLRAVRRVLKEGPPPAPSPQTEAVRDKIKVAELSAEQLEQAILVQVVEELPASDSPADGRAVLLEVVRFYGARGGNVDFAEAEEAVARIAAALAAG